VAILVTESMLSGNCRSESYLSFIRTGGGLLHKTVCLLVNYQSAVLKTLCKLSNRMTACMSV